MTTRKINLIVKEIKSILGDNATVEMHEVTKNNGLILHGVTIRFDDSPNVIPNIYIENYDKSHTSREIAKEIIADNAKIVEEIKETNVKVDLENLTNFNDFTKSHIVYRLVNKKANEELLKTIPHRGFLDLAIIYAVQITGETSCKVTNELMKSWNVNEEILYDLAKENTPKISPAKIQSMFEVMLEVTGMSVEEAEMMGIPNISQIVVTNRSNINGATSILYPDVMEELYTKHGKLAILPSSIHEMIIVPYDGSLNEEDLTKMVQEVNTQCVSIDEILSDHVYIYDGEWK